MSGYLVFLSRGNELGYLGPNGFTGSAREALRFEETNEAEEAFLGLHEHETFNSNLIYELVDNTAFASVSILNERTK